MSTIPQQIQALNNNITSLRAMVNGVRDPGKLYALLGDFCVFGCKVTQGTTASDLYLALEGQATGDESHANPDVVVSPLRHEEYPNIAVIYGEVFELTDVNASDESDDSLLLQDAPGTANYGRYDLVFLYLGKAGPAIGILTGTASAAVKTDFTSNGLDRAAYPSAFDPTLPKGVMPIARVYVQTGDTGIANARIADLRKFKGRLNPIAGTGKLVLHTGNGRGAVDTASRRFSTIVQNNCSGITYSDSANTGAVLTCTKAGIYQFSYEDIGQSTTSYMGLAVNPASLTTAVESITPGGLACGMVKTAQGLTLLGGLINVQLKLNVGDTVRCLVTLGTFIAESNLTRLYVEQFFDN